MYRNYRALILGLLVLLISVNGKPVLAGVPTDSSSVAIQPALAREGETHSEAPATHHHPFIARKLCDDITSFLREPDFYALVGALTLTPIAFQREFDRETPGFTDRWRRSPLANHLFESGEVFGQAIYPIGGSIALLAISGVTHAEPLRCLGSDLLRAQIITGVLTWGLKSGINRERPGGGPFSYPSGHTSSAFATAGVIYGKCGAQYGIPALAMASYVGLSRLEENKHYFTDVLAGGILGGYIGYKVAHRDRTEHALSVFPVILNSREGVSLSLRF